MLVTKKGLADVEREHLLAGGAGREDVENETKSQSCARSFRARILATLFSLRPEVVREVCVVPSPPFAVATHRDHVVQVTSSLRKHWFGIEPENRASGHRPRSSTTSNREDRCL